MFKIFKKFAFVALMALFHIYESWGVGYSAPKVLCCHSNISGCGWGSQVYASSLCSRFCSSKGYSYYKFVPFSANCGGANGDCACYSTSAGNLAASEYQRCNKSCPSSGTYWVSVGIWSGTTSVSGGYTAFTCYSAQSSACNQTNTWTSYTTGMQRQKAKVCGGNVSVGSGTTGSVLECLDSDSLYNYRCNTGYYGIPRQFAASAPICTRCPATYQVPMATSVYGTTSGPGAASTVTSCYQPANVTGISDSTGSWTWTQSCYSCGVDQPTCTSSTVSTACWASGFTSCTSQGCCMSTCSTYVCDPTAPNLTGQTYAVKNACWANGYTTCTYNCCTSKCSTTVCDTTGMVNVLDTAAECKAAGWNNTTSCVNHCCTGGAKCNALFAASGNTTGRCTSDSDCRADTSTSDYSCNTTTGCCQRETISSCTYGSCTSNDDCLNGTCNTITGCCSKPGVLTNCKTQGNICTSDNDCLTVDCNCGCTSGRCTCTQQLEP